MIKKEALMTYCLGICMEGESTENPNQDGRCAGRDSNPVRPECK